MAFKHLATMQIMSYNAITSRYGLLLTETEAAQLAETHADALQNNGRVDFTGGTIRKLILAFCNSPFLLKSNYAENLSDLIDTFYYFKNETQDEIGDSDLIHIMKQYFDNNCQGSMDLLQGRELETLARHIRSGYRNSNPSVDIRNSYAEDGGRE
jgi:hypothetical protein